MVLLGHAEQIGDDQGGEWLGIFGDEFALAGAEELIELAIGEAPHELLVVLQSARCQQPTQHRSGLGVVRWIHRDHVLVHRELTAVLVDQWADVVALGREGQRREWAAERDDVGERAGVLIDLGGFVVAGDSDDPVMRQPQHRVLSPQVVEVGVWIGHQRPIGEEVDRFVVAHLTAPFHGWVYS